MEARRLGRTDIRISPIGLGCWQLSRGRGLVGGYWKNLDQEEIDAIVKASLEGGIDWFDTAEVYGHGASEEALAAALRNAGVADGDVFVATKWWPMLRRAGNIVSTVDERLARLGGYSIGLHQIHQPLSLSSVSDQMAAMAKVFEAGKIRSIGVSNFSARRMRAAHQALASRGLVLASNQVRYSLLHRRIERNGVLAAAKELGVTIIAYSPLEQGLLTGKFHDDPEAIRSRTGLRRHMPGFRPRGLERSRPLIESLRRVAAAHEATPAQVALAWLLQLHGDLVVAIPGATRVGHVTDNVGAMKIELERGELDELDSLSRAFL